MTYLFCECEHPIAGINPDEAYRCHRCGRDITLFRLSTEELGAYSVRVESSEAPAWDEAGFARPELVAALLGTGLLVLAVVVFWQYLVGAGVIYGAYRHLTRGTRRRRPRSSWSSLGRTVALMYAAWNSRGLVRRNGRELRVSVPAAADGPAVDVDGIPY